MGTPTRLSVAATAAILTACATPYKPESVLNQGGYSEQRRAPGVFAVWFRGNAKTTEDRCEELAVLRAAELCLGESKSFMRTSDFQTSSPAAGWVPQQLPHSALKVECFTEKSADTQEAAEVAASIRKRYGIAARAASTTPD